MRFCRKFSWNLSGLPFKSKCATRRNCSHNLESNGMGPLVLPIILILMAVLGPESNQRGSLHGSTDRWQRARESERECGRNGNMHFLQGDGDREERGDMEGDKRPLPEIDLTTGKEGGREWYRAKKKSSPPPPPVDCMSSAKSHRGSICGPALAGGQVPIPYISFADGLKVAKSNQDLPNEREI